MAPFAVNAAQEGHRGLNRNAAKPFVTNVRAARCRQILADLHVRANCVHTRVLTNTPCINNRYTHTVPKPVGK